MRERRIDRIRLCRTGSDERNLSALLMTNAGSSLNRTFGSMREILSDRSIVRNASNCEARKLGASHGQSGVIGSSVVLVPTFPGTYPHDAQPDYFRINNPAVIEWRLESKCRAATAVLLGSVVNFAVFVRNGRQSGICLQNICSSRSIFTNVASALQGF